MPDFWDQFQAIGGGLVGGAANSAIGAGLGLMLEKHNDARQIQQQTKLQNLSIAGSKELTDYQMMKQLQMWKDTNYSAQMAELKKAGLNPGLLYGMSGGGATTTGGEAAHVGEGNAQQNPGEIQNLIGMGIANQTAMNAAQIDLMKAQAEKARADAKATGGYQKDLAVSQAGMYDSQGKLNLANTENVQANTKLTEVVTKHEQVKLEIAQATVPQAIAKAQQDLDYIGEQVRALADQNYITEATARTKIDQAKWDLLKTISEKALIDTYKDKTDQEIDLLKKDNQKYFDKLESLMGLQSRQGISSMTGANAQERQALTAMDEQALARWLHDMPDSEKEIFDILEKAAQAIILKQVLTPAPRTPIGYKK